MRGLYKAGVLAAAMCLATAAGAQGRGGMNFGPANTPGWSLMTAAERAEHRSKMMGFTDYGECAAYQEQHHKLMQERAQAKGITIPDAPRRDMCERLKHADAAN